MFTFVEENFVSVNDNFINRRSNEIMPYITFKENKNTNKHSCNMHGSSRGTKIDLYIEKQNLH